MKPQTAFHQKRPYTLLAAKGEYGTWIIGEGYMHREVWREGRSVHARIWFNGDVIQYQINPIPTHWAWDFIQRVQ